MVNEEISLEDIVNEAREWIKELYEYLKSNDRIVRKDDATLLDFPIWYSISIDGDEGSIYIVPNEVNDDYFDEVTFIGRQIVGRKKVQIDEDIIARVSVLYDMSNGDVSDSVDYIILRDINVELLKHVDQYSNELDGYLIYGEKQPVLHLGDEPVYNHWIRILTNDDTKYDIKKIKEIRDELLNYQ